MAINANQSTPPTDLEPTNNGRSTPALALDKSGTTHMVWNEAGGQIYHSYYDSVCGKWIEASPIPGAAGGFNLNIQPDVAIQGPNGVVTSGIVATWVNGEGNNAEILYSVGQQSTLGEYQWGQPVNLSQDTFNDDNPSLLVTPDGQVLVVSQKLDVEEPEADTDLYAHSLTVKQGELTYSPVQKQPFVIGDPLTGTEDPEDTILDSNFAADVGIKIKPSAVEKFKAIPVLGNFEGDLRYRVAAWIHDYKSGNNSFQAIGDVQLALKIEQKGKVEATFAAYVQKGIVYQNNKIKQGTTTLGLQIKAEIPFKSAEISLPSKSAPKIGGQFGLVIDFTRQVGSVWKLKTDNPPAGLFWAELVRKDGKPVQPTDDPSDLKWEINIAKAAADAFTPPDGDLVEVINSLIRTSIGAGLYAKAKFAAFGFTLLELKAALIGYLDLLSEKDKSSVGLRERIDLEAILGPFSFRERFEFRQQFGEEEANSIQEIAYDPIRGSSSIYGDTPILGDAVAQDLTNDGPASLAVGADGTVYLASVQEILQDGQQTSVVSVAKSTDGGKTFGAPVPVPGSEGINLQPVVQVDKQGQVVVAWTHGNEGTLSNTPPGQAYVIFGGSTLKEQTSLNLNQLDGENGFAVTGSIANSQIGYSVSGIGDVNNDGIGDFVVGAPDAQVEEGRTYVIFGNEKGFGTEGKLDVNSLDGSNGFVLTGAAHSESGFSVSQAGDVNGDKIADLVVGAPDFFKSSPQGDKQVGRAYVILGKDNLGAGGSIGLEDSNQSGVVLDINIPLAAAGSVVSGSGDFNGDQIDDLVIGAPGINGETGATYIVYGNSSWNNGSRTTIDLEQLNGSSGLKITSAGVDNSGLATAPIGQTTSFVGDVNDDGKADLLVGSTGLAFLVFGQSSFASGTLDLGKLNKGSGLTIDGREITAFDTLQVSAAGDINGDQVVDLLVSNGSSTGEQGATIPGNSYAIFGGKSLTDAGTLQLSDLNGKNGFVLEGAGSATAGGDVTGDGIADVLIGNPSAAVGDQEQAGKSYLVYGSQSIGAIGAVDLNQLPAGEGLVLNGATADDVTGTSVSIGDVDGDQVGDLIVGAPQSVSQKDLANALGQTQLNYSNSDNGASWSNAAKLNDIPAPDGNRLAVTPNGLLLTWIVTDPSNSTAPQDKLYGSFWNGSSWGAAQVIATGDIHEIDRPATATAENAPLVMWTESIPNPNDPNDPGFELYSSTYTNGSWSQPAPVNPEAAIAPTATQAAEADAQLNVLHESGAVSHLQVSPMKVMEDDPEAVLTITRTGAVTEALSVEYTTADGSATADADYVAQSGSLSFAPGETQKEIRVQLLDDEQSERRAETFQILISSDSEQAYRTVSNLRVSEPAQIAATVTAIDDEPTQLAAIGSGFILAADPNAEVGAAVSSAGDVNQDNYSDFLIGAPGKAEGTGSAYLVYGSQNIGFAAQNLSLDNLDGTNGTILTGTLAKARAGQALAAADLNQDNYADVVIGAPGNSTNPDIGPGQVYVVSG